MREHSFNPTLDRVEIGYFSQRVEHNTMVPIQGQQRNILVVNFLKEMWHLEANRHFVDRSSLQSSSLLGRQCLYCAEDTGTDLEDVLSQR